MREIKFRAWHINKMGGVSEITWDEDTGDVLAVSVITGDIVYEQQVEVEDRWDMRETSLMQYTGLKDKNGKEIYEGDIIKDLRDDSVGTVEWLVDGFVFDSESLTEGLGEIAPVDCEVVGNIYENPELLSRINSPAKKP